MCRDVWRMYVAIKVTWEKLLGEGAPSVARTKKKLEAIF